MNVKEILHSVKIGIVELSINVFGSWRVFCYQSRSIEKKLIKRHYTERMQADAESAVVFTCNGFIWHGGLVDRFKGALSVYEWCKRNGRTFKINFVHPFNLSDYLCPTKYDWQNAFNLYDSNKSQPKVCLLEPRTSQRDELKYDRDRMLNKWLDGNLSDASKQLHVYTNMNRTDIGFASLFNELFRPVPRLQTLIDEHLANIGGKYISISFRFTTLLGDFTDCTGSPLPPEERTELIERSLEAIKAISRQAPAHDKILVTADSETFLVKAKEIENVYVIPGKVGHIDYDHGDDVNMKTFLDFFLISMAEKVYLARSGKMYNSAFAKTASLVNNKPFEVYEY